jgi:hypothetical protein
MELHEMLKLLRAHAGETTRPRVFPLPVACERLSVVCGLLLNPTQGTVVTSLLVRHAQMHSGNRFALVRHG